MASAHLGVVSSGILGHSTLLFHQETEPPALLGERCLVAVRHVVLQLALLVADGVDVLGAEGTGR